MLKAPVPTISDQILEGSGGAIRPVQNGIEIYVSGAPAKKYQVIGLINLTQSKGAGLDKIEVEVARLAKLHGGDAVLIKEVEVPPDTEKDFGADLYHHEYEGQGYANRPWLLNSSKNEASR